MHNIFLVHGSNKRSILNVQLGIHDEVNVRPMLSSHFCLLVDLQGDSSSSTSDPSTSSL